MVLCHASHSMKVKRLPSWCPDFATAPVQPRMGDPYMIGKHPFAAGFKPIPSGKEQVKLLESENIIELAGSEVDMISNLVSLDYSEAINIEASIAVLKWYEACQRLVELHFEVFQFDIMSEFLCMTVIAGGRLLIPPSPEQPVSQWVQDHKEWKSAIEASLKADMSAGTKPVSRFDCSITRACHGRRFFTSPRFKLMGFGPMAIQVGDLICILYSQSTPFILRPYPDKNTSTYRLIEQAYVNGVMDGEASELQQMYSLQDKTFVLK
jgi:hypothetical protein